MEFYHHSRIHFGSIHVVDALHVQHVLVLALQPQHLLLLRDILITNLVIEMLVNRNVLQVVFVLFLAAQGQFCTFI